MSDEALGLLRLEIERPADPGELVNLVQNPSGALGAWAWVTPVAGSLLRSIRVADAFRLEYTSPGAVASYFYTEPMAVTVGTYIAGVWVAPVVAGRYRVRLEWLDADGILLSPAIQSGYLSASDAEQAYGPYVVPAGTTYCRLRFDHYADISAGIPAAGTTVQLHDVTVTAAATSGALGVSRTNLLANPSGETGATGWTALDDALVESTTVQALAGTHSLALTRRFDAGPLTVAAPSVAVVGGRDYAFQAAVRPKAKVRKVTMQVRWFDAAGKSISLGEVNTATPGAGSWTLMGGVLTAPSNAASVRMRLRFGDVAVNETHYIDAAMVEQAGVVAPWFDGDSPDAGGITYSWTGTPHASTSTAVSASLGVLAPVKYLNILGPTHELQISREDLNVGTLSAVILDVALDPAQAGTIQRGRRIRLVTVDGEVVYSGKVDQADVTYPLLAKDVQKRAQITLTALDAITPLAASPRSEGVATIPELPYVLEGCGVPWNVNGSGDQVATAEVVAYNSNASALDQVAITRDSQLGYVWVDRNGVLQAWDRDLMDSTVAAVLDETVYNTSFDVGYSTADCVNAVTLSVLTVIATTGVTEEVTYGPYRDEDSIREHGLYPATYTVQGIAEDEATLAAYAQQILDTNATPTVRVNQMVIPIRSAADLSRALLDLYDLVEVSNDRAGIDEFSRITRLEHSITPGKWLLTVGFSGEGIAAPAVATPSPPPRVGDVRTEVLGASQNAYDLADLAFTSADGKTRITISLDPPGATPNTGNEVWWQKEATTETIIGQWQGLGGTSWQEVTVADAMIANLSAGKLIAGTAFTNELSVKTNFTLGDASTNGVIQSYDFAGSSVGVFIDKFGLVAKGGSISGATVTGGLVRTTETDGNFIELTSGLMEWHQGGTSGAIDPTVARFGSTPGVELRSAGAYKGKLILEGSNSGSSFTKATLTAANVEIVAGVQATVTGGLTVSGGVDATGTGTFHNQLHGNTVYSDVSAGGGTTAASIDDNGKILRTPPSTRRVKENIEAHEVDADAFVGLGIFTHTYLDTVPDVDHDRTYVSLMAEDLAEAGFEPWVTRNGAGEISGIQYDRLAIPLLAVAKRHQARLDEKDQQIAALTTQLAALADRVAALEGL